MVDTIARRIFLHNCCVNVGIHYKNKSKWNVNFVGWREMFVAMLLFSINFTRCEYYYKMDTHSMRLTILLSVAPILKQRLDSYYIISIDHVESSRRRLSRWRRDITAKTISKTFLGYNWKRILLWFLYSQFFRTFIIQQTVKSCFISVEISWCSASKGERYINPASKELHTPVKSQADSLF